MRPGFAADARGYARDVLGVEIAQGADHPALAWRRAGLMQITGPAGIGGLICPVAVTAAADAALLALRAIAPDGSSLPESGAALLGERARLMGLRAGGLVSAGGACRVLRTPFGALAISLARPSDFAALPAWLECGEITGWDGLAAALLALPQARFSDGLAGLVARGRMLGLALAGLELPCQGLAAWPALPALPRPRRPPVVVDFSALWAGPLAASLLGMLGARVIKVESFARPDGARAGHAGFYNVLNAGKQTVAVDFAATEGRAALARLVRSADIVISAAMPRVWPQLGLNPAAVAARGAVWLNITGHAQGPGFGDDAAMAGGLGQCMQAHWGAPYFAGDALADPLTGLHAAYFAYRSYLVGEGAYVDLPMSEIVAGVLAWDVGACQARTQAWQALAEADRAALYALRAAPAQAAPLGAHTAEILAAC